MKLLFQRVIHIRVEYPKWIIVLNPLWTAETVIKTQFAFSHIDRQLSAVLRHNCDIPFYFKLIIIHTDRFF